MKVIENTSDQDHPEKEDKVPLRTIVVQMKRGIDLHHLARPREVLIRIENHDVRGRIHLNAVEMINNPNVNEKENTVAVLMKRTGNIEEKDIVLPTVKKKQM